MLNTTPSVEYLGKFSSVFAAAAAAAVVRAAAAAVGGSGGQCCGLAGLRAVSDCGCTVPACALCDTYVSDAAVSYTGKHTTMTATMRNRRRRFFPAAAAAAPSPPSRPGLDAECQGGRAGRPAMRYRQRANDA